MAELPKISEIFDAALDRLDLRWSDARVLKVLFWGREEVSAHLDKGDGENVESTP